MAKFLFWIVGGLTFLSVIVGILIPHIQPVVKIYAVLNGG